MVASTATVTAGFDFGTLLEKAKKISARRTELQVREQQLRKQVDDLQASLTAEFGEDYMDKFEAAVAQIRAWDDAHAGV
jgi:predicted transcriptional regulator